jgi:hypothetical protein
MIPRPGPSACGFAQVTEYVLTDYRLVPRGTGAYSTNQAKHGDSKVECLLVEIISAPGPLSVSAQTVYSMSQPKLWVVKPSKTSSAVSVQDCCKNPNCAAIASLYADEKEVNNLLQSTLNRSKESVEKNKTETKLLKDYFDSQIVEMKVELGRLKSENEKLKSTLQNEKKLRIEEFYKHQSEKDDNEKLKSEVNRLKEENLFAIECIPQLRLDISVLKERLVLSEDTILKLNEELLLYGYDLAKLEDQNSRLKMRIDKNGEKQIGSFLGQERKLLPTLQLRGKQPARKVVGPDIQNIPLVHAGLHRSGSVSSSLSLMRMSNKFEFT